MKTPKSVSSDVFITKNLELRSRLYWPYIALYACHGRLQTLLRRAAKSCRDGLTWQLCWKPHTLTASCRAKSADTIANLRWQAVLQEPSWCCVALAAEAFLSLCTGKKSSARQRSMRIARVARLLFPFNFPSPLQTPCFCNYTKDVELLNSKATFFFLPQTPAHRPLSVGRESCSVGHETAAHPAPTYKQPRSESTLLHVLHCSCSAPPSVSQGNQVRKLKERICLCFSQMECLKE